jgi:hypothetical protein
MGILRWSATVNRLPSLFLGSNPIDVSRGLRIGG